MLVKSRPDFVFYPKKQDEEDLRVPIAIFVDGFQFHKNSIAEDTKKRMAIKN